MTIQPWELDPDAVAFEFMTAGGWNTPEQIDDMVAGMSVTEAAAQFADEANENWTLHVTKSELLNALVKFLDARPDRNN